jgi:peptidyl-tRNA hydrolase
MQSNHWIFQSKQIGYSKIEVKVNHHLKVMNLNHKMIKNKIVDKLQKDQYRK